MLKIIVLPSITFDDGTLRRNRERGKYKIFNSMEDGLDYLNKQSNWNENSLFSDISEFLNVEIWLESNPSASEIRDFAQKCKKHEVVLIIRNSHRAKFDKDKDIDFLDLSSQRNIRDTISRETNLSPQDIQWCINTTDNPLSALSIARQMNLINGDSRYKVFTIDPNKKDSLPWTLIDYIVSGNQKQASREAANLLISGLDPVALCFQIEGYMQKIIMSLHPEASDTKWFASEKVVKMFENKARKVTSASGLAKDLSEFPDLIISSKKKFQKAVFLAMVSSLATRFNNKR